MGDFFLVLGGENSELVEKAFPSLSQAGAADLKTPKIRRFRFAEEPELTDPERSFLQEKKIDWAILPVRSFSSLKFIMSDMDSTLITIECIDELAALSGIKEEVAKITARAMQGELDFTASLKARVRLLKGLPEAALMTVAEKKLRLNPGGEALLSAAAAAHVPFILVSGGFTFFTDYLRAHYPIAAAYANELVISGGVLTGEIQGPVIDGAAKAALLRRYQNELQATRDDIIAVGDGANDIAMLNEAGFSFAFHAKPKTKKVARTAIDYQGLDFIAACFL